MDESGGILINDKPVANDALFKELEAALADAREKVVILRGDKKVLLGQAVNILDLAQQAGAKGIALATKPPAEGRCRLGRRVARLRPSAPRATAPPTISSSSGSSRPTP